MPSAIKLINIQVICLAVCLPECFPNGWHVLKQNTQPCILLISLHYMLKFISHTISKQWMAKLLKSYMPFHNSSFQRSIEHQFSAGNGIDYMYFQMYLTHKQYTLLHVCFALLEYIWLFNNDLKRNYSQPEGICIKVYIKPPCIGHPERVAMIKHCSSQPHMLRELYNTAVYSTFFLSIMLIRSWMQFCVDHKNVFKGDAVFINNCVRSMHDYYIFSHKTRFLRQRMPWMIKYKIKEKIPRSHHHKQI